MRIAVFGGTFNPIHNGHLAIAHSILDYGLADEVWLMVTPCNPWKQDQTMPDNDVRLEMVRAAVQGRSGLVASDFEFSLPFPQYTSTTLKALTESFPQHEFVLAMGADNWVRFTEWHDWQFIADNFELIVYPRPGYDIPSSPAGQGMMSSPDKSGNQSLSDRQSIQSLPDRQGIRSLPDRQGDQSLPAGLETARVTCLDCGLNDVSSTLVRSKVASGLPIDSLVPLSVAQFISSRQLYCHSVLK